MLKEKKFYIAGVQFRTPRDKEAIRNLHADDLLALEPEPDNKYDPNAVRIIDTGNSFHFGYVPKKYSSEVAAAIDLGSILICKVTKHNPSAKWWEVCEVTITEEEEPDYNEDDQEPYPDGEDYQ